MRLIVLLLALLGNAAACEVSPVVHGASMHLGISDKANGVNYGIGALAECGSHNIEIGAYRNSGLEGADETMVKNASRISAYAIVEKSGFFIGAATGYDSSLMPLAGAVFDIGAARLRFAPMPYFDDDGSVSLAGVVALSFVFH